MAAGVWGLNRKQWTILFAAWLGWGFDVFDALLFSYVAPNCVPTLLGLVIGSPEAKTATLYWTGVLTSILLIGWAVGGVLFGVVCDRIGRTRTLMWTMLLYAIGTAACAFAPNLWTLIAFRIVASLGIGGEWAAGASMVAEAMPDKRRVAAGALLYTASPLGLFLATFVNFQVAGVWLADQPSVSWRYVFLFGLIPAAIAFVVRWFVNEPERWQALRQTQRTQRARLGELFDPAFLRITLVGSGLAFVSLITWWSCNAFIATMATGWAQNAAQLQQLTQTATLALVEDWKFRATFWFNLGGLLGTLLTIPLAQILGRRAMFAIYFIASAMSIFGMFGIDWPAEVRLYLYFFIGVFVFGVCGAFTYYLPELFPTRLRATGAGFCFNIGRVVAAAGPFIVGAVAARGQAMQALFFVGLIPLFGLLLLPLTTETRGKALTDI
ncbi:MAG: MFS transporter [Candidatus Obscuribacterales bacterium]|nr:MFS transporter [Steroidobacteraceae bacterium]